MPEEYTTYFRSVITFGKAHIIDNEDEKRSVLEILTAKYSPDNKQSHLQVIEKELDHVCLIELAIEHMTGKEAIELVRAKQ